MAQRTLAASAGAVKRRAPLRRGGSRPRRPRPRHPLPALLPNVVAPLIVTATLGLGTAILSAAVLGFLGLGSQPPQLEWGRMLSEGRDSLREAWWIATFPGLGIMLTVLDTNLLGDWRCDVLDPRLKGLAASVVASRAARPTWTRDPPGSIRGTTEPARTTPEAVACSPAGSAAHRIVAATGRPCATPPGYACARCCPCRPRRARTC